MTLEKSFILAMLLIGLIGTFTSFLLSNGSLLALGAVLSGGLLMAGLLGIRQNKYLTENLK